MEKETLLQPQLASSDKISRRQFLLRSRNLLIALPLAPLLTSCSYKPPTPVESMEIIKHPETYVNQLITTDMWIEYFEKSVITPTCQAMTIKIGDIAVPIFGNKSIVTYNYNLFPDKSNTTDSIPGFQVFESGCNRPINLPEPIKGKQVQLTGIVSKNNDDQHYLYISQIVEKPQIE